MTKAKPKGAVMLSTEDEDLGLIRSDDLNVKGQEAADELGVEVTARHPISDEVVATFAPRDRQAEIVATLDANDKGIGEPPAKDDAGEIPAAFNRKLNPVEPGTLAERRADMGLPPVEAPTAKVEEGRSLEGTVRIHWTRRRGHQIAHGYHQVRVLKLGRKWVTIEIAGKHVRLTREAWNEMAPAETENATATKIEEKTDMATDINKPLTPGRAVPKPVKAAKGKPAPKAAKAAKPAAKPARKREVGTPTGITAECIKLAQRPKGVTPAELNEKSQWKGAPWKWLFQNPKKTGWADKYGLKFRCEKKDGETRYYLSK